MDGWMDGWMWVCVGECERAGNYIHLNLSVYNLVLEYDSALHSLRWVK